jgi:hypothetical protein
VVLGIKPRASHMTGKCSTIWLHSQPSFWDRVLLCSPLKLEVLLPLPPNGWDYRISSFWGTVILFFITTEL